MDEKIAIMATEGDASVAPQKEYVYVVEHSIDFPDDQSTTIVGVYKTEKSAKEKFYNIIGRIIDCWEDIEDKNNTNIYKTVNSFEIRDADEYSDEVYILKMELK